MKRLFVIASLVVLGAGALVSRSQAQDPSGTPQSLRDAARLLEQAANELESLEADNAELRATIAELEAEIERLKQTPTPTPTVPPCEGIQASTPEDISAAPTGATICLTGEIRITSAITLKQGQTLTGGGTINGSVPVTNWTQDGNLWVASRSEGPTVLCMAGLTPCDGSQMVVPHARFADDIFYEGSVLTRTGTLLGLRSAVAPSFFIDYAAERAYINRDPTGRLVELAVAGGGIRSDADDITIRDITVEKTLGTGIYFLGGQDWTLENVTSRLNHGSGVRMGGGATVHNSDISWNGMLGMGGSGSGIEVLNNTITFNNYARYQKAPNGGCWSAGAMKWTHATVAFSGNTSSFNWCDGFWADNDVTAVVTNNTFEGNLRLGAFWELQNDGGTMTFANNTVINNGADGFRASDAGNALIENNTFAGNETAFAVGDSSRPGGPTNITFRNNILNGQPTPGCSVSTVTCVGNVP